MEDFLMRAEAPLNPEEWARIDQTVVGVAQKLLVGRRVIEVFGPVGAGLQTLPTFRYGVSGACLHTDEVGACENDEIIGVSARQTVTLPLIHKDFALNWRDIATSRQFGLPLDLGGAAAAAAMVAAREDQMIFEQLLAQEGRAQIGKGNWGEPGGIFGSFVEAAAALAQNNALGPYAAIVSPAVFAQLHRPMLGNMGMLEITQLRELATGGVYQTPVLGDQAILISQGAYNLDLVIGQDLTTAYLGPERMMHLFRVLESLMLRVKRPEAIAVIG